MKEMHWPDSGDPDKEAEVSDWLDQLAVDNPYAWQWGRDLQHLIFVDDTDAAAFKLRFGFP